MIRVYRYGLLAPIVGAENVAEQMSLAHRYQNTLIEIERARREAVRAILSERPEVSGAEARVHALVDELERRRAAIKAQRQAARSRSVAPELLEPARDLRGELREARAVLKTAKAALRDDTEIKGAIARINEEHHARHIQARAECGVYWGSYLQIEQAVDAARKAPTDPRFRRWTGDGAVSVQAQGGLALDDALSCADTRLQIALSPAPVPGRGGKPLPRVRLRVGSDGRAPIWAEWPLIYHRPLPAGARIKWAKVVRRRVASHDHWSLHLTIEYEDAMSAPTARGAVAVDLGWRREAGTLRAGGWADDSGGSEEIMLNPEIRGELRKVEDLRSIRDKRQNEMQATLLAWREAREELPPEHIERMAHLAQWRAPGRFASLAIWWRDHRIDGDAEIFESLEAWRKKDKHLWEWEANARRGALARRRDQYRCLAKSLSERYGTLVLERLGLKTLASIPAPESERESNPAERSQRVETAPSELRTALEQAFRARGRTVVTVPPAGPASALLEAYRERSGVDEKPVVARVGRFSKLRARRAVSDSNSGRDSGPLENSRGIR